MLLREQNEVVTHTKAGWKGLKVFFEVSPVIMTEYFVRVSLPTIVYPTVSWLLSSSLLSTRLDSTRLNSAWQQHEYECDCGYIHLQSAHPV